MDLQALVDQLNAPPSGKGKKARGKKTQIETKLVVDGRDWAQAGHLSDPQNIEEADLEYYAQFNFADMSVPHTKEELLEMNFGSTGQPYGDPQLIGHWNPLLTLESEEEYDNLTGGLANPLLSYEDLRRWQTARLSSGNAQYLSAQNILYLPKIDPGSKAPKSFFLRSKTGLSGELSAKNAKLADKGEELEERFYKLPKTVIQYAVEHIYETADRDIKLTEKTKYVYGLGGPPGGGKSLFAKQLAAHLGVPLVHVVLETNEALEEQNLVYKLVMAGESSKQSGNSAPAEGFIGNEEQTSVSVSRAVLTDFPYVYQSGGVLLVDDVHHYAAVDYLSKVFDPGNEKLDIMPADSTKGASDMARHPGFRVVVTYNGPHHMEETGASTELADNIKSRMTWVSDHFDLFDPIVQDSSHWIRKHEDPKVRFVGAVAVEVLKAIRGNEQILQMMPTIPSVRALDDILSQNDFSSTVIMMPLRDGSKHNRENFALQINGMLADIVNANPQTFTDTLLDEVGWNPPAGMELHEYLEQHYGRMRQYVRKTYKTEPLVGAFNGDLGMAGGKKKRASKKK